MNISLVMLCVTGLFHTEHEYEKHVVIADKNVVIISVIISGLGSLLFKSQKKMKIISPVSTEFFHIFYDFNSLI